MSSGGRRSHITEKENNNKSGMERKRVYRQIIVKQMVLSHDFF